MRSFVLLERPEDRRRNRLVISGFIVFTVVISYIIYGSVAYGLSKMDIGSYSNDNVNPGSMYSRYLKVTEVNCGKDNKFKTWIVDKDHDKERGLSIFSKINNDNGMLFVFNTPNKYPFWMKDMKFPIDMIWLDQNKQIVDIKSNVATSTYPELFSPSTNALYVLEFNAGVTEKTKIKIGDNCNFDFSPLK